MLEAVAGLRLLTMPSCTVTSAMQANWNPGPSVKSDEMRRLVSGPMPAPASIKGRSGADSLAVPPVSLERRVHWCATTPHTRPPVPLAAVAIPEHAQIEFLDLMELVGARPAQAQNKERLPVCPV
jgi:hypothetical protein